MSLLRSARQGRRQVGQLATQGNWQVLRYQLYAHARKSSIQKICQIWYVAVWYEDNWLHVSHLSIWASLFHQTDLSFQSAALMNTCHPHPIPTLTRSYPNVSPRLQIFITSLQNIIWCVSMQYISYKFNMNLNQLESIRLKLTVLHSIHHLIAQPEKVIIADVNQRYISYCDSTFSIALTHAHI